MCIFKRSYVFDCLYLYFFYITINDKYINLLIKLIGRTQKFALKGKISIKTITSTNKGQQTNRSDNAISETPEVRFKTRAGSVPLSKLIIQIKTSTKDIHDN